MDYNCALMLVNVHPWLMKFIRAESVGDERGNIPSKQYVEGSLHDIRFLPWDKAVVEALQSFEYSLSVPGDEVQYRRNLYIVYHVHAGEKCTHFHILHHVIGYEAVTVKQLLTSIRSLEDRSMYVDAVVLQALITTSKLGSTGTALEVYLAPDQDSI